MTLESPHEVQATPRAFPQFVVFTTIREVVREGESFLGSLLSLLPHQPQVARWLVVATTFNEEPHGHGGQCLGKFSPPWPPYRGRHPNQLVGPCHELLMFSLTFRL
uniref:Uncharacterized protein n=1 Tax=Solanum tuberosum TaxID=4113 RepID=M1DFD5_SOLTU